MTELTQQPTYAPKEPVGGEFFDYDPDIEWTRAGSIHGHYNTQLSVLGWSLLQKPQQSALAWTMEILTNRKLATEHKIFTNLHGYPFVNLSLFKKVLPLRALKWIAGQRREAEATPRRSPLRELLLTASFLQNIWRLSGGVAHDSRNSLPQCLGVMELLKMYRPQSLDDEKVLGQIASAQEQAEWLMQHQDVTIYLAELHYHLLRKLIVRWLGEKEATLTEALVSGLPNNLMEQSGRELGSLAEYLRESKQLQQWLESATTEEFLENAQRDREGMVFLQALKSLMFRHGHLSSSRDVAQPFWWEDTAAVLALVRSLLHTEESTHFSAKWEEARRKEREQAEAFVRARLPVWKRLVLKKAVARARTYLLLRDKLHYYDPLPYSLMKRNLKVLAERLVEKGQLFDEEEIYLLTMDEVSALVRGKLSAGETGRLICKRRRAPRVAVEEIPLFFKGAPDLKRQPPPALGENLVGVSASPGKATGTIRVVTTEGDFTRLRPGDVVVTKTAHPVWAPLFAIAGGVVAEYGNLSSQGAALARGHGIPFVLGVRDACVMLQEGQTVTVDGTMGWVTVQQA